MSIPIRIATGDGSTSKFLRADGEFSASLAGGTITISGAASSAQTIDTGGNGTFSTGDVNSSGNSTRILLNDSTQRIALLDGVGSVELLAGVVTIGDWAAAGNGTTLIMDDNNRQVKFSGGAKYVSFANDQGIYVMDTGTATFWNWQSVNGVWTGTDTGSATPP